MGSASSAVCPCIGGWPNPRPNPEIQAVVWFLLSGKPKSSKSSFSQVPLQSPCRLGGPDHNNYCIHGGLKYWLVV